MKSNKDIVIKLLIQDMKQEQLMSGMRELSFQSDLHGSDISAIVAALMGIAEDDISEDWMEMYLSFIRKAKEYIITDSGTSLRSLAETCYVFLAGTEAGS